jgi:hypothetical protein
LRTIGIVEHADRRILAELQRTDMAAIAQRSEGATRSA